MIVTTVTIYVLPEHVDGFICATIENHRASIGEPGNLRFDFLQCVNDHTRFLLYEAYESPEAAARHKEAEHYIKWRDMVAPWMAKPREGVPHRVLCPEFRSL